MEERVLGLTCLNGIEEICLLFLFLHVCIDQKRIGLRVDVLHHDLKTIEAASFWDLDFTAEAFDKVLVNNSVRSCEEREDMRDEISLIIIQSVVPIMKILREINLLCGPEGCFGFFVHLPDLL